MVLMLVSLSGWIKPPQMTDGLPSNNRRSCSIRPSLDADRSGAFADEWRKINELKELKAYKAGMATKVLPAPRLTSPS